MNNAQTGRAEITRRRLATNVVLVARRDSSGDSPDGLPGIEVSAGWGSASGMTKDYRPIRLVGQVAFTSTPQKSQSREEGQSRGVSPRFFQADTARLRKVLYCRFHVKPLYPTGYSSGLMTSPLSSLG